MITSLMINDRSEQHLEYIDQNEYFEIIKTSFKLERYTKENNLEIEDI